MTSSKNPQSKNPQSQENIQLGDAPPSSGTDFEMSFQPKKYHQGLEFKFCNLSLRNLQVFIEPYRKKVLFKDQPPIPLKYLFTIPADKCVFVYPKNLQLFVPGTIIFSKFEGDEDFAYKPYTLTHMDEIIYFGEISTDFVRTRDIHSDRNEILSLYIENRSLKPYHVFYRGDYLGLIGPYYPTKHRVHYSMLTNNNEKHFQLGTWIDFIMDDAKTSSKERAVPKRQSIQLRNKFTTDIYVGDVVGRTQENG